MQKLIIGYVYLGMASAILHSPPLIIKQPPTDDIYMEIQRTDDVKPFILECEAEGNPKPTYKWIKNGEEFNIKQFGSRISQMPNRGTLVFINGRDEDVGYYQCYAVNELGVATSNSVNVRNVELFGSAESTEEIFAEEGKPLQLGCRNYPDGSPKPKLYWVLMSQVGAIKTINSSRMKVGPDNSLWFSSVERSDQSSVFYYACLAYSVFMNKFQLGHRVYLSVFPNLQSQQQHAPVTQYVTKFEVAMWGHNANLWCIIGGKPRPEIRWEKVNSSLPYDRIEYDNYGGTLRIRAVDFSDTGIYSCHASNGVAKPTSHSFSLVILTAPYFTIEPEIYNAVEGEDAEFRCDAGGKPAPEIQWTYNGKPINETKGYPRRKLSYGDTKILIENVVSSDTGNYGCNASNSLGYVYKDVYLLVHHFPAEITERPVDVAVTDGKNVTLRCRIFGAPKPQVQWLKNNQILTGPRLKLYDNGDLEILHVVAEDTGSYTCYAKNKFGNDTANCQLSVKKRSKITVKPEDQEIQAGTTATFRCSAVSDSTLTLNIAWLSDGEEIDFENEKRYKMLPNYSLVIDTATQLDSGVYTCNASTELDSVSASAMLIVQDVPNRPELIGVTCGSREAKIMWRPMGDNNSPILHYTIEFSKSVAPNSSEIANERVLAVENSYTLPISPSVSYKFRMIAKNKIGSSVPSIPSDICNSNSY